MASIDTSAAFNGIVTNPVTYDDSVVGAAVVTINSKSGGIQQSNYGQNSFEITNTGGKKIAAVLFDVTDALYPDTVFDPEAVAGDTVSKGVDINTPGGTGVESYVSSSGNPDVVDPFVDAVGQDAVDNGEAGGALGFEGVLIKFDLNDSGGFTNGEYVGFSADMDPNSIAGLPKSVVDDRSAPVWDVGGVSGAELIGSTVTILFDDGTTAAGQLMGDGSNAGSQSLVTQETLLAAPTLLVNGVAPGGSGTYGGNAPQVVVDGPAGETVRVVLTKGFNPVILGPDDPTYGDVAGYVEGNLAPQTFEANNAAEFQTVDVVLMGSPQDISHLFDYENNLPGNGSSGNDTLDNKTPPVAFAAAIVDPDGVAVNNQQASSPLTDLPISAVTQPIYLESNGVPAQNAPPPTGGEDGVYLANSDGDIVFEVEDAGLADQDGWEYETSHANSNHEDFTGSGYYLWEGGNSFNTPGNGVLTYEFMPETDGVYYLNVRGSRLQVSDSTEENDVFARVLFDGASVDPMAGVKGGTLHQPDTKGDNWQKVFQSGGSINDWLWANKNVDNVGIPVRWELEAGKVYSLQLSGRSNGFEMDRVHLELVENPPNIDPNQGPIQNTNPVNPNENAELSPVGGGTNGTVIEIFDAQNVTETGDSGSTTLVFTLTATGGFSDSVDIAFQQNGTAETATVNFQSGSGVLLIDVPNDAVFNGSDVVNISGLTVTGPADVTVASGGDSATGSVLEDDSPDLAEGDAIYRVNAGGPTIAATDGGIDWDADSATDPSPYWVAGAGNLDFFPGGDPGPDVPSYVPGEIFDTARSDNPGGQEMKYEFAVDPGFYEVRLYFANGWSGTDGPGERVFDTSIEGVVYDNLDNLDLSGQFGHEVGVVLPNTVEVTDGTLDIEFIHDPVDGVQNPIINGIEIVSLEAAGKLISLTDADAVIESGDTGSTNVIFGLTSSGGVDGLVELAFSLNGQPLTATVNFANGTAELGVSIPNDDDDNGPDPVDITGLTVTSPSDVSVAVGGDSATGSVLEDDGPQPVGAATLGITQNANNVQVSNFGNNSFQISNVGDKDIAKIEIDVTNALYLDSVFDPFGEAGDTTGKLLEIANPGSTGVIMPDHGTAGSPGSTYIGAGGVQGFEAIQLLFDQNVDGGFNPGETIGFGVDMDPNSIAGAIKAILDTGADPEWDIGGISGAELIGSSFTVTFTDGTTATGELQGAGNQGGSKGLATQAPPDGEVTLSVNGLAPGGVGTYADGGPSVIVNGPAGSTARVVLSKGIIQPVTNEFPESDPYHDQLDAQLAELAASDFPANNAAEFQTVDILLDGTDQDITDQFDFTQVLNYDLPVAEDQVPLAFVASIIDPSNQDLPTGPVSAPVYLTYSEGDPGQPVANPDSFSTPQAQTVFIPFAELLANDIDPNGDAAELTVVDVASSSSEGALITIVEEGVQALYGPPTVEFTGTDTFTYTIEDAEGKQATGTITVDVTAPFVGDANANTLTGTDKSEKFYADAGDDDVDAGGGIDFIFGFLGDDTLDGGAGNDAIDGEGGADLIMGGSGLDWLYGGGESDEMHGGDDTDAMFGQDGDDLMMGDGGGDNLDGGLGNDTLKGGAGVDWLFGQEGEDLLEGGDDGDALFGGDDDDVLYGENGGDGVDGGAGNDQLFGGAGVDYVYGQEGDDRLYGGADLDALFGGAGADVFAFDAGSDEDQIFDFEDDIDQLEISFAGITEVSQLTQSQVGENVHVTVEGQDDVLIVINQTIGALDDDFVFV